MSAAHENEGATESTTRLAHDDTSGTTTDRATPEPEWRQPTGNVKRNPNPPDALRKFSKFEWVRVSRSSGGTSETVEAEVKDSQAGNGRWEYKLEDKNGKPVWIDNPCWIGEDQLEKIAKKKR